MGRSEPSFHHTDLCLHLRPDMFLLSNTLARRGQTVRLNVRTFVQDSASKPPAAAEITNNAEVKLSRKERIINYLTMVKTDYREALREVTDYAKRKPIKATILFSALGVGLYANHTNPDEKSFRENFIQNCQDLSQVGDPVRSQGAEKLHDYLARAYNAGLLRRLDLWVCSVIWVDDGDKRLGLYSSQCEYLRPTWADMRYRMVDVGVFGVWWISSKKMVEYDVSNTEWTGEGTPSNKNDQLKPMW